MPPRPTPARPTAPPERTGAYVTKQELVYRSLREAIMRCELGPGRRLVIDDLARRLNVSAIPVREALQLLTSERLVVNVPHVGATVAPIAPESVREVFTVMEGLETVAAREAAARLDAQGQGELNDLLEVMDEALRTEAYAEWSHLNSRFHLAIAAITGMPLLRDMTERALGQWDRIRRHFFEGVLVRRVVTAQREHHELFEAMKAGAAPAIEDVVRRHNRGALQDYTQFIRRAEKTT
jgi:DNA-binding GntR family transcriptional regulator